MKLAALSQNFKCPRLEVHVQTELTVPANVRFFSQNVVNGIDQIERTSQALALSVSQVCIDERMCDGVESRSDRDARGIISFSGNDPASCGLVVSLNEIVNQLALFGPQRVKRFAKLPSRLLAGGSLRSRLLGCHRGLSQGHLNLEQTGKKNENRSLILQAHGG